MELFIAAVVVALMCALSIKNVDLEREKALTRELSMKLDKAVTLGAMAQRKLDSVVVKARREGGGRDPSRL